MSPERTSAYRRVMHTLRELGPSKLQPPEQDRLRHAADALIFAQEPGDSEAAEALADARELCRSLVESGRWEEVTAARLADDLAACGPGRAAGELQAA